MRYKQFLRFIIDSSIESHIFKPKTPKQTSIKSRTFSMFFLLDTSKGAQYRAEPGKKETIIQVLKQKGTFLFTKNLKKKLRK